MSKIWLLEKMTRKQIDLKGHTALHTPQATTLDQLI
jgi:hypothetical protein